MAEKATIVTVAHRAQVSRQTVSNVLNTPHLVRPETKERVLRAIEELGYRANLAARQMRTGRSRLVAVRIEPTQDGISGTVIDRFLHGLTEAGAPAGYRVMLYSAIDADTEIAAYDDLLTAHEPDGFVLLDTHHGDVRTSWLAERGVPFVTFGRPWGASDGHPWVDVDGAAGTAAATRHLIEAGHERIGFLGWPPGSDIGEDRRAGWDRELRTAGLDSAGLLTATPNTIEAGEAAAHDLSHRARPPTALVCASDSLALGALQATRDGAVAVIGFDDTPVARAVGLTSVAQPLTEAATRCMTLLAQLLHGETAPATTTDTDPTHVLLAPTLMVRRSG
jgi:DNA-binding LacI/PurR family transcriptional regulator